MFIEILLNPITIIAIIAGAIQLVAKIAAKR